MGKFFFGGVFLGAAVTWTIMHFFVQGGLKGDELERAMGEERTRGRHEGRAEAQAEFEAQLAETTKSLNEQVKALTDQLAAKTEESRKRIRELENEVDTTKVDLDIATQYRQEAAKRIEELSASLGGQVNVSRQLVAQVRSLLDVRSDILRRLTEAASVLNHSLIGWPDIAAATEASQGIGELAAQHRQIAQSMQVFIDQQSRSLSDELGDLAPYRRGIQAKDIELFDKLAEKVRGAVGTFKYGKATVSSTTNDWTDTDVFVRPGDVIQVRSSGTWRMALNSSPVGAEGWDEYGQFKIERDARSGSLIMQIGVADKRYPAYLGKPIVAETEGRIRFRMNDREVRDNSGAITVEVVAAGPAAVQEALEVWEAFKAAR